MRQLRLVMVRGLDFHFHQMACNHVEKFEWAPLALHQYILPVLLTSEAVARQVLRALFDLLT
jgi:hypothetical protein